MQRSIASDQVIQTPVENIRRLSRQKRETYHIKIKKQHKTQCDDPRPPAAEQQIKKRAQERKHNQIQHKPEHRIVFVQDNRREQFPEIKRHRRIKKAVQIRHPAGSQIHHVVNKIPEKKRKHEPEKPALQFSRDRIPGKIPVKQEGRAHEKARNREARDPFDKKRQRTVDPGHRLRKYVHILRVNAYHEHT